MLTYLHLIWLRCKNRWLVAQLRRKRALHHVEIKRLRAETRRLNAETERLLQEKAEAITGIVGAVVLTWARLENHIDLCVEMIHEVWGQAEIQHDLPPSLDRELDYLKAAMADWRFSEDAGKKLMALLPRIHSLKTYRHDFVHGVADLWDKDGVPVALTRVRGAIRHREEKRYTADQFRKKVEQVGILTGEFIEFTEALSTEFLKRQDGGG